MEPEFGRFGSVGRATFGSYYYFMCNVCVRVRRPALDQRVNSESNKLFYRHQ